MPIDAVAHVERVFVLLVLFIVFTAFVVDHLFGVCCCRIGVCSTVGFDIVSFC